MNYIIKYILILMFSASSLVSAQDFDTERIPIGDEARKYNFCSVKLDKILNTKFIGHYLVFNNCTGILTSKSRCLIRYLLDEISSFQ